MQYVITRPQIVKQSGFMSIKQMLLKMYVSNKYQNFREHHKH